MNVDDRVTPSRYPTDVLGDRIDGAVSTADPATPDAARSNAARLNTGAAGAPQAPGRVATGTAVAPTDDVLSRLRAKVAERKAAGEFPTDLPERMAAHFDARHSIRCCPF